MIGDNKPSLTDLLAHVDKIGNLSSDLREFMKAEGETITNGWKTIEPVIDGHIATLQDQLEKAKAALENATNLKIALKETFAATEKSVSSLIGLKAA